MQPGTNTTDIPDDIDTPLGINQDAVDPMSDISGIVLSILGESNFFDWLDDEQDSQIKDE